jgi:MoaA/NifB/PqqE/SkfB family radical SAM enzyme
MERLFKLRPDLVCYAKLAQRKVGYIAGQVELTSECSQHCLYCDSWRAHTKGTIKGTLTYSDIIHLIQQLNAMPTFEHLTFTGGDPQNWVEPNSKFDFEALLSLLRTQKLCYTLQVNTALVKPIKAEIWREALSRVRVSLDSVRRETYKKLRGDGRDPEEIIERMEELAHPGISTMTCVSEGNSDEVPGIIERLYRMKYHRARRCSSLFLVPKSNQISGRNITH